ncbi:MAG TPA: polysaccharide deacetylase family protein [Burkholderiales bacterium]|nr:polysaccharide deacetylase family protein [Burkholderiales bacterium]
MTAPLSVHAGGTEIMLPPDFRWPGGKRIAVLFRVAFEAWSDDHWPGISPMGNPLKPGFPDLNARGWAEYAHRRGIFRVLDALARHRVKATVMVCGILAERYPQTVRRIAEAGHEVAAHSYAMDRMAIYLSEDEERRNIRHNAQLIERATGARPVGWINPRGTPSPNTARLLAEEGFEWHGDTLNDDLPYLVRFGRHSIVAIPSTMEVNDLPLAMKHGQPPGVFVENFRQWLAYARRREKGACKMDPTIHAHVFGRPAGIWAYERVMEIARRSRDVWIGTRAQAAAHVREVLDKR